MGNSGLQTKRQAAALWAFASLKVGFGTFAPCRAVPQPGTSENSVTSTAPGPVPDRGMMTRFRHSRSDESAKFTGSALSPFPRPERPGFRDRLADFFDRLS